MQRRYRTPRATTPGRYLLTSLVYLAGSEWRLHGYTMRNSDRPLRLYHEEQMQESDRPSFRAEVVENTVLAKLRDFLADKRNQRAIQAEISRRTRKAQGNVEALERQLGAVRARIKRGTEKLAMANSEDMPGISWLLAMWSDEEAKLKEKLQQARRERADAQILGDHGPDRPASRWSEQGRPREAGVCDSPDGQADHAAADAAGRRPLPRDAVGRGH